MSKKSIKCSKCGKEASYNESSYPERLVNITEETGFVITEHGWLCQKCTEDHFHSEGC